MPQLDVWRQMSDALFKRTDEGEVFFPHGVLGHGYVVNDAQKAEAISAIRHLYRTAIVFLIIGIFCVAIWGWPGALALIAILLGLAAYQYLYFRNILRGSQRSRNRFRLGDAHWVVAQRSSYLALVSLTLFTAFASSVCAMLALMTILNSNLAGFLVGFTGLLAFGFLLFSSSRTIWLKWSRSSGSGGPPR
jgi:hypothetical protein